MAIVRVSRSAEEEEEEEEEGELRSVSTNDEEASASEEDGSGMASDEFDLSDLGEPGVEFCQLGNQTCSIPLELYNLPDLTEILSVDTWNNCLSGEDRFALAEFLPDMDQESFVLTLRELFSGANFHFGSPLAELFRRLKGGMCDLRVVLYCRGLSFFQRREHYHRLCRYQNSMVGKLVRIRNAWENCEGYGIEERVRFLNILRSQRDLGYDRDEGVGMETDSESRDSSERFWNKKLEMARRTFPPPKIGKESKKGLLKVVSPPKFSTKKDHVKAVVQYTLPAKKNGRYIHSPQQDEVAGFDLRNDRLARNRMAVDYEDHECENWNTHWRSTVARSGLPKQGRKHESPKRFKREVAVGFDEEEPEGYARSSHYYDRAMSSDHEVTVATYDHRFLEAPKKSKYSQKDWMCSTKDWLQQQAPKGPQADWLEDSHPLKFNEFKSTKSKAGTDAKAKSHKKNSVQAGDSYFHSDHRASEKLTGKSAQKGMTMEQSRGSPLFAQSEETESKSSDQAEENRDINYLARKMVYPGGATEGRQSVAISGYDSKKAKKLTKTDNYRHLHDDDAGIHTADLEPYSTRGKQKGKSYEPSYLHDVKMMKKGQGPPLSEKLQQVSSSKSFTKERKRKEMVDLDYPLQQSDSMHYYGSGVLTEDGEDLDWNSKLADAQMQSGRSINRPQAPESHAANAGRHDKRYISLLGCSNPAKKRKGKVDDMYLDDMEESVHQQSSLAKRSDNHNLLKKGKMRNETAAGSLSVETPELLVSEKRTTDICLETKTKKKPFTLISPSIHTGFSFSIIHLLSAVRKAMITRYREDTIGIGSHFRKDDGRMNFRREEQGKMLQAVSVTDPSHSSEDMDAYASELNLPSLTVQEIVNRVRSNPGDPCILEAQEPLQDLIRGVLKILASKTAPLGAKGWKVLVFYEKSNKSWTWVGPVSSSSSDTDAAEEDTSAEAWGIPHKMLVKLVDAFANWLKGGQATLQQIGSLPAPPLMMLPNIDEKERFKDLRAQKSLNTFSPSSDAMKAYFRTEEHLRYSVPDRAFSYTAYDGKKSIVAPLRRGGGKPTSKARDHSMLKPDRPPHVTILCLVRDAAARLPGSIGTRADVCTLIRDSQYVVEDVSDAQVNQVVSGALDRLHYECDPCVRFDGERKLWVYLHRDREEEDFEEDGTSSTKKWKRQRKDLSEPSYIGTGNEAGSNGTGDPVADGLSAGYELNSDLNIDSPSVHAGEQAELIYNGLRTNMENIQSYIDSTQGGRSQWGSRGLNSLQETKILCQQNSTSEDFDDESFSRERTVGLVSARLL